MLRPLVLFACAGFILCGTAKAQSPLEGPLGKRSTIKAIQVVAPPESFFQLVDERDRDVARQFYRKYITIQGLPVVAAAEVADQALQQTYSIIAHMLAGRPDVLESLVENRMYLIIIGKLLMRFSV